MRKSRAQDRRGFALIAVLWVLTSITSLSLSLGLASHSAVDAAQNRIDLLRARWIAEGCADRERAVIEDVLYDARSRGTESNRTWRRLDAIVASYPIPVECNVRLDPSGTRLDVNGDSVSYARQLLLATGLASARVDSLLAALEDWRDADEEVRERGAERAWYLRQGLSTPRNDQLRSVEELQKVRGFSELPALDSLVGVEPERIVLDRAPAAVLASLPGITNEAIARLIDSRTRENPINDIPRLSDALTPEARAYLLSHFAELSALTVPAPEAWTLVVSSAGGARRIRVNLAVRLVEAGSRTAIVRRRVWP